MNSTQVKVIGQVDETAIVDLASELIKIPSFKLEETPVATFLADFFGRWFGTAPARLPGGQLCNLEGIPTSTLLPAAGAGTLGPRSWKGTVSTATESRT